MHLCIQMHQLRTHSASPGRGQKGHVSLVAVGACETEHLHRLSEGFVVLGCHEGQRLTQQILCRIRSSWEVQLGVFLNSRSAVRAARGRPALRFLPLTGGRLF